jgi:hypothetical protein
VHVAQRPCHLEFDHDLGLDHEVGGLFANDHVVVKDNDSPLLDDAEPALWQLVGKGFS